MSSLLPSPRTRVVSPGGHAARRFDFRRRTGNPHRLALDVSFGDPRDAGETLAKPVVRLFCTADAGRLSTFVNAQAVIVAYADATMAIRHLMFRARAACALDANGGSAPGSRGADRETVGTAVGVAFGAVFRPAAQTVIGVAFAVFLTALVCRTVPMLRDNINVACVAAAIVVLLPVGGPSHVTAWNRLSDTLIGGGLAMRSWHR